MASHLAGMGRGFEQRGDLGIGQLAATDHSRLQNPGLMTRVVRSCTTSVNETRKQFFGPARSGGSAHFLVGCTGVSDAHDRLAADF